VDAHVENVYALVIFGVESAHVGPWSIGLDHHGDPVELGMAGMEDMSCHCSLAV
jgi:hypothetical protein